MERKGELLSWQAYMALYQHLRPTSLAFGLGGDPECLARMREALTPHFVDAKLVSSLHELETKLLQVDPGSILGPKVEAPVKKKESISNLCHRDRRFRSRCDSESRFMWSLRGLMEGAEG